MLAATNPFDWRTVLLARHAQHVVLIHFPIALYLVGVALDVAGLWLGRRNFSDAAYYNFSLAAAFAIPAAATGLLAWQWQLEGQKLKGILLEHLIAGLTAAVVIAATWLVLFMARRKNSQAPQIRFLLEGVGVIALMVAGHLGGFVSGVNAANHDGDSGREIIASRFISADALSVHAISEHSIVIRPKAGQAGGGDADVFVGGSVIKKPIVVFASHAFYEHHVGNLAGFLPSEFGRKNGLLAAVQNFPRIVEVEDRHACAVDEFVVGAIVNEHDAFWGEDGRRARLDDSRIELAGPTGQHRRFRLFPPMHEIF